MAVVNGWRWLARAGAGALVAVMATVATVSVAYAAVVRDFVAQFGSKVFIVGG